MRKWTGSLLLVLLGLAVAAPVLACMAIPFRPINRPVDMHLTEQRALIYQKGGEEHLILSVKYAGATDQFAWVVPTETRPHVDVQEGAPFHELWRLTEIVRPQPQAMPRGAYPESSAPPPVVVIERKVAGPYELVVLRATSGGGLYDWLSKNGYRLTPIARGSLDYYATRGWYFAAARIRPGGASNQEIQENLRAGTIAALHLSYRATHLSYPLRATAGNPGTSSMEIYVVGNGLRRPRLLEEVDFTLRPSGAHGFAVSGPPGLAHPSGDYPTLRSLLPSGGQLHKYTATLSTAQRMEDLVFGNVSPTAMR